MKVACVAYLVASHQYSLPLEEGLVHSIYLEPPHDFLMNFCKCRDVSVAQELGSKSNAVYCFFETTHHLWWSEMPPIAESSYRYDRVLTVYKTQILFCSMKNDVRRMMLSEGKASSGWPTRVAFHPHRSTSDTSNVLSTEIQLL